ncbi:MAG: hypothetical protein LKG40_02390 [Lachnospiraceae bacterium]|jgi:hypothetical protein|nr:hypothetical protein [Lachnospiraceae bacterium]MCI1329041.1 hypothetical protein [Lachnospiraceae bacterium]
MEDIMKMAEISLNLLKKPFHRILLGRPWDEKDEMCLMEYDVLSISVLLYIFSDADGREKIRSGLNHLFGIEDPQGAILFFLSTKVNAPYEGEKLFRRVDFCVGFFRELEKESPETEGVAAVMHQVQECVLLAVMKGSDDVNLNAAVLILSSYLTCRLSQIHGIGVKDETKQFIHYPSFSKLSEIFKSYGMEVEEFVPFEDQRLNDIAMPIYTSFRNEIEKDCLVSFTEKNKDPQRLIAYTEWEYAVAVGQIYQMNRHIEEGDLADFYLRPSQMTELKQAVGEIYNLEEEAEEVADLSPFEEKGITLRDLVTHALLQYFMYLSASDGFYARKEAQAIGETLGIHFMPPQMGQYVRENNIYSASFDEKVPELLKGLVRLDNGLEGDGYARSEGYGERLVGLMEKAGELFLQIDGSMNDDEKRDLGTYISTMRNYLNKNLKNGRDHNSRIGI